MLRLQAIYKVPTWCLCYLANGDWDNMTEEEKSLVDEWYEREFPNGVTFDFGDGEFNPPYFDNRNDIGGLAGDVQDIAAYVEDEDCELEDYVLIAVNTECGGTTAIINETLKFADNFEASSYLEWKYLNYDFYGIYPAKTLTLKHEKKPEPTAIVKENKTGQQIYEEFVKQIQSSLDSDGEAYIDWGAAGDQYKNCPAHNVAVKAASAFKTNGYFVYIQRMSKGNSSVPENTRIAYRIFTKPSDKYSDEF